MTTPESQIVQPGFPHVDLSERDASRIGLLFANGVIIEDTHILAEVHFPTFSKTHPILIKAAIELYDEPDHIKDVEHGIKMFEGLHSYVSSAVPERIIRTRNNVATLADWLEGGNNDSEVRNYLEEAKAQFATALPNTARALQEASCHYFPITQEHVLFGAAMARAIKLVGINLSNSRRTIE